MDWHEQSGQLQLSSFVIKDRASRLYRFLVDLSIDSSNTMGDFREVLNFSHLFSYSTGSAVTTLFSLISVGYNSEVRVAVTFY